MTFVPLILASACVCVCVSAQRFSDYDTQDAFDNGQYHPEPPRHAVRAKPARVTTTPPPPAAILKQINTHNEDGSYTYGYEADDGSFKIETKKANGDVTGKYGYVDTDGKVRTVEYGANRYGFQPSGTGITVPPPTLVDETLLKEEEEELPQQFQPRPRPAPRPVQGRQHISPRPRPQPVSQPIFVPNEQQNFAPRASQPIQRPQAPRQPIYEEQRVQQYESQEPVNEEEPQYEEQPYVAPVVRPRQESAAPVPPRAVVPGAALQSPSFYQNQAPVFEAPRRKSSPRQTHRSSPTMLDNLAQQYALPSNPSTRPVADFSFNSDDAAYSRTINF